MSNGGFITLIAIIFVLFLIYIIMRGKSASMKRKMDARNRFRRRRCFNYGGTKIKLPLCRRQLHN